MAGSNNHLSNFIRKSAFRLGENKDADYGSSAVTAKFPVSRFFFDSTGRFLLDLVANAGQGFS